MDWRWALPLAGFLAALLTGIIVNTIIEIGDEVDEIQKWQAVHEKHHEMKPQVWPGGP